MKNKLFILILIFFLTLSYFLYKLYDIKNIIEEQNTYINKKIKFIQDFNQHIYQNFPIWEDWISSQKEKDLRRYLYPHHIDIAKNLNIHKILSKDTLPEYLISIDNPEIKKYYFFYNVPKHYRYFYNSFMDTLIIIGKKFNEKIHYKNSIIIKLAISSALRPEDYQKELRKRNINAIENSTHSYGISIDIFYEEFYIDMEFICDHITNKEIYNNCIKDINQTGYILGGNLRRQLQSILAEILLELQNEKQIYVIWEKNQRVFHITPIRE